MTVIACLLHQRRPGWPAESKRQRGDHPVVINIKDGRKINIITLLTIKQAQQGFPIER